MSLGSPQPLRRSPKMDRLCSAELTHQTAG
jgi:hypothetical protein